MRGDNTHSVVLEGSLVEGRNGELDVINGGATIRLSLVTEGEEFITYKRSLLESDEEFEVFLADMCRTPATEENGFVSRIHSLITREATNMTEDARTLEFTLQALPEFQIHTEEVVYLHIPSVALDCECSYRIPVLQPIVILEMQAPTPVIIAPAITCGRVAAVSAPPLTPSPVEGVFTVHWSVHDEANPDAYIEDPSALATNVWGLVRASNATVTVVFKTRDNERNVSAVIERVESPEAAEVMSSELHVAGTTVKLNALPPQGGGAETHGEWSIVEGAVGTILVNPGLEQSMVEGLGNQTELIWQVSGHARCPATQAALLVLAQEPHVAAWEENICGTEVQLSASPPALSNLRGTWSVVSTDPASKPLFTPSPNLPSVKVVHFGHGPTTLQWTLSGDRGSSASVNVTFTRRHEPYAEIVTQQPEAFLGAERVPLEAVAPAEGEGEWSVLRTTCSPEPWFSNETNASTELLGLDSVDRACEIVVDWKVQNRPCVAKYASLTIYVVARPPTQPSVGAAITLCEDVPVELTGNDVEVGVGVWKAVQPADLVIPDPSNPRTILQSVREGVTIVSWVITNGDASQSAELTITRHALPKALLKTSQHIEFCGNTVPLHASRSHFNQDDYGKWSAPHGTFTCNEKEDCCNDCAQTGKVNFTGVPPGDSSVTWTTYNSKGLTDCPEGRSANVTLKSWQFPTHDHRLYVTEAQTKLDIAAILALACEGEGFYPSYITALSELPGVWELQTPSSSVDLTDAHLPKADLAKLPMGETKLYWTPIKCHGTQVRLMLTVVRGDKLSCDIFKRGGETVTPVIDVVGDAAVLTTGDRNFSVSALGAWFADRPVNFSNQHGTITVITGLEKGDTTITFRVSAYRVDAFAGECSVTVRSWRADAYQPAHPVCFDSAQIEGVALGETPEGLTHYWRLPRGSELTLDQPTSRVVNVGNLQPGPNPLWWRIELGEDFDEFEVVPVRHTLPLPFNSTSLVLKQTLVNTDTLTLPWVQRTEFPSTAAGWVVPLGHSIEYIEGNVVFKGITSGNSANFSFYITPVDSACVPTVFTLVVESVDAHVVGSVIGTECELLAGAVVTLRATEGLTWKHENVPEEHFAQLAAGFGKVLSAAFASAVVDPAEPHLLHLHFNPAELPATDGVSALTVSRVPLPVALLSPRIVTSRHTYIIFEGPSIADSFTIRPIDIQLSFDGARRVSERTINEEGGTLTVTYTHANVTDVEVRANGGANGQFAASLAAGLRSRAPDHGYGWDARSKAGTLLAAGTSFDTAKQSISLTVLADPWYTIGDEEEVHLREHLSTICGHSVESGRIVRSGFFTVTDTAPEMVVRGAINECDFEQLGATVEVSVVGCSFKEDVPLQPQYLHSDALELEKGWEVLVQKSVFAFTSNTTHPKHRTLQLSPIGKHGYEIPAFMEEHLSFSMPSALLAHSGIQNGGKIVADGEVSIKDTTLSVEGTVICADTLRREGHNVTLILHGDAWGGSVESTEGARHLVGAMSGDPSIKGGWESIMVSRILPQGLFSVVVLSPTVLEVRIPALPWFTSQRAEVISLQLPGTATVCSKCLEHNHLMHIYHAHNMVPTQSTLQRPDDSQVEVTLPCARYAASLTHGDVKRGLTSDGDSTALNAVVGKAWWSGNSSMMIPFNWRLSDNHTNDEEVTLTLSSDSVVPSTGEVCTLFLFFWCSGEGPY